MVEKLNRIIVEDIENVYEFTGGGSTPASNSVGTDEIKDESIKMEDLSPDVRKGLDELNNINLTDEDMEKWFDDDPSNDDPEETPETEEAGAEVEDSEGGGVNLDDSNE